MWKALRPGCFLNVPFGMLDRSEAICCPFYLHVPGNSPFLTHGSSVGRFGSHCNRSVAMENQHALRESVRISRTIYCTAQLFAQVCRTRRILLWSEVLDMKKRMQERVWSQLMSQNL